MSYSVRYYNARWWVNAGPRLLGGYCANDLRSYLFPLYTPQGLLVVQEAPVDHPHHQGLWAGLEVDGYDLWNAGSFNLPRHRQIPIPALNAIQPLVTADGVEFDHQVQWQTAEGELLLYEDRNVTLRAHAEATQVLWRSRFSHPAKSTRLGQTKESGIGLRVPPHWESSFGGQIRNASGDVGEAAVFDKESPWLNIEGQALGDAVAGLVFLPTSTGCPWFTRDYGCHVYNPARQAAIHLTPGEVLTWSVTLLAYDGHRTIEQIDQLVLQH
jgi:hypothetical protein